MSLELQGKRALITGASKGIGLAVARTLASLGAEVHLAARSPDELENAAQHIHHEYGFRTAWYAHDLSKSESVAKLAEEVGDIDILVNNAGAIPGGSLTQIDEQRWRQAWELKVFGYINLTRIVYEQFSRRGAGVIVNIIGMAGVANDYDYICGSAGNAALIAFTNALGSRSVDKGVRVVGINPTATRTQRQETLLRTKAETRYGDENRWQELLTDLPFGRLSEPQEVAELTAFLASPRAAYLSGTVINLDGGRLYR
ncbi:SDR family oxidoreductase [Herbaspirillum lusitanum]|uniref:SDR family oxidoreductase n=1 Tax=Herbaspirillum lusitanum TaxID=213312 RepID=A0ABW9AG60_9BURK